ncbi:hypothetical protein BC936DRAFT_145628 [Jimgerdemannia flammicorona]|uniref:Signal transduction histidine kinase dimerisation/phosphoacceptor domain-containing protein n=1 Tax=Jimgerdemannia flammicorona TaxID=994334 RepID=A0A433D9I8_9FUNG|nr:hypothetical protein BC936DRAFT_145628 [Jimgerdemannia flammicorona]
MPIASFIDSWIPQQIRNGANPTSASNYVRIELFHARVTVSILLSSIFVAAVCLLFGSSNVSWQISGVLVLGVVASLFQLYGLSTGRVTLVVCTRNVVFFLALTTAALILFGNGFWWIGHSIFFAIPPFSYVFVGREFASTMTYLCATLYVGLFAWSLSHDYDGESIVSTMTEIFRSGHLIFELTIVIVMWTLFVAYMQEKNGQTRLSSPFDEVCYLPESLINLRYYRLSIIGVTSRLVHTQLKEKSDSKARLISTMGHELRTPIHGMLAIAEMLSTTTPLSDDQRILLGSIQNCGRNLIQIVNHALKSTEAGEWLQ